MTLPDSTERLSATRGEFVQIAGATRAPDRRQRLPVWLRSGRAHHESVTGLRARLKLSHLHTVCESARCPNMHECFHRGTATFMILGNLCTRGCGFCAVPKGSPARGGFSPDSEEPARVGRMAASMKLSHVVVTSVNRDDLPDGGAEHFAETVRELRRQLPQARIEVLTPDFQGDLAAVRRVLDAGPDIFNHNLETVARLYARVRPQAVYERSLAVLRSAKLQSTQLLVKSGLMAGLGEEVAEVEEALGHLRQAGVDVVTIGQYLQPTRRNLPVAAYIPPQQFDAYRGYGLALGFRAVFSGPLVRSSYMADRVSAEALAQTP